MSVRPSCRLVLILAIAIVAAWFLPTCRADSSDEYDENGVKKSYYWQGNQLNNLSRLGNTSDFEQEQRQAQGGKSSDQYLSTIRAQMAHQGQANAQQKSALSFDGQLSSNAIEVTYLSPGMRVTLHEEALFDENSATMKLGAIDTLDRLSTLLGSTGKGPLQLVLADQTDDIPESRDLDAQRSLAVLTRLAMAQQDNHEDLTPEILTR
jgi:hypothetical protein